MAKKSITLLDLGGVVFQSSGISNERINWKVIIRLNHKYGHDLNIGLDKFPAFLKEYNHLTNQKLSGQEFLKSVFDTLDINQDLIDIVRKDSDVIIVSDNYRENIDYISQRYAFDSWAIKQIYSFDYGLVKGDPLFFERLIDDLKNYDLENLIFIDDSPNKLESAEKVGIRGILFLDNQQVEKELRAIRNV